MAYKIKRTKAMVSTRCPKCRSVHTQYYGKDEKRMKCQECGKISEIKYEGGKE